MNRRSFIGWLAALPVAGKLLSTPTVNPMAASSCLFCSGCGITNKGFSIPGTRNAKEISDNLPGIALCKQHFIELRDLPIRAIDMNHGSCTLTLSELQPWQKA